MKELNVTKISAVIDDPKAVHIAFDKAGVAFQDIDVVNWEAYPYKPLVKFRIAHTGTAILLEYIVDEASVRAKYGNDNGSVWTDSCVEFFIIPGDDGIYYNLECNCIGTVLLGAGSGRSNRVHGDTEVMQSIKRWSSLGDKPFDERLEETSWNVALIIPYTAFFQSKVTSLDGKEVRANFYKCGDELQTPHFVSWNPIETEKPDFHRPEFFGKLVFE